MMIDLISIILYLFAIIILILSLKLWINSKLIIKALRKYPNVYFKILFFYPHKNLSFSENYEFTLKKFVYQLKFIFLFQSLFNNQFNNIFNNLMNITELEKIDNKDLNNLINNQRKLIRILGIIINFAILLMILYLIGFIIFILFGIQNGGKIIFG